MAQKFNLLIDQGSSFKASLTVFDLQNDPFDITEFDITGQIRKKYGDADVVAEFTPVVANSVAGIFTISLTPEETDTIPSGEYVYDVQISDLTDVFRIVEGVVRVFPRVTRAASTGSDGSDE
jgi:hypothetical protein